MNKIELLAPVGDYECLLAAVENGADAVYLGGQLFNARENATNFGDEELNKAIDYCHLREVKVYLTLNTLILDSEIESALNLVNKAYSAGIDAIIVQDLGIASLIHKNFPDLDLHASTQMSVYNLDGVKEAQKLGIKRVVLARELSLEEIQHVCQNTDMEIEVFIHGALCVSYSGQCLMSSIIGGRSGNRGKCAQPCRLPYSLIDSNNKVVSGQNKFLLSPKDICTIDILKKVVASGVKSLKIEGRMKTPEYVATVVKTYRKYLDSIDSSVENADKHNLEQIFNRGGLYTGYFEGKTGISMMSHKKPKNWGMYLGEVIDYDRNENLVKLKCTIPLQIGDGIEITNENNESTGCLVSQIYQNNKMIKLANPSDTISIGLVRGNVEVGQKVYKTSDKTLNQEANSSYQKNNKKVFINGKIEILKDKPVVLNVTKDNLNIEIRSEKLVEAAINKPISKERVEEQIKKTGQTSFEFRNLEIILDADAIVPVSVLNDIRRNALEQLENKIINLSKHSLKNIEFKNSVISKNNSNKELSLYLFNTNIIDRIAGLNIDRVYISFSDLLNENNLKQLESIRANGIEVIVHIPNIIKGNYEKLIDSNITKVSQFVDGFMISNIGQLKYIDKNKKIFCDYTINCTNSFTIKELCKLNIQNVTLSPELTLEQINDLGNETPKEAIVYGRLPLMTSEYCPVGCIVGGFDKDIKCNKPCFKDNYRLRDRKDIEFPIVCQPIDCRSVILNSNPLFLTDDIINFNGISSIRLNIFDEPFETVANLVDLYNSIIQGRGSDTYKQFINSIRNKGYTKGHYFRGV